MIPLSARGREDDLLRSFRFDGGTKSVAALEARVAAYHGLPYAVAFNTPESALLAALHVTGAAGGTVLTSAMAPLYHYTAGALAGATAAYADIKRDGTLLPQRIPAALSPKTDAVLNLHFCGITPDHAAIGAALPQEAVSVIDDASNALKPRLVGDLSLWSLQQMMPLAVEPTGFVLAHRTADAEALRLFRSQGRSERVLWNYDLRSAGCDGALSPLTASVALHQMARLEAAVDARLEHAAYFAGRFGTPSLFDLPAHGGTALSEYPVLLAPALYCPKEDIFTALLEAGVEAGVCCKPVYKTERFADPALRIEGAEDLYRALLLLPCHHRMEMQEREKTADLFLKSIDTYAYRGCSF